MISQHNLSCNLLPQRYEYILSGLREYLKDVKYISLTTDTWTSNAMQNYVAITGHYINKNWELKSALLDCINIPVSDTAENLKDKIIESIASYGLKEKVVAVTGNDNAANVVAAIELTGWNHIPCFVHAINLIFQEGIQKFQGLVKKVKTALLYEAMKKYKEIKQKQINVVNNIATSWNSTYYMLEKCLMVKKSLIATQDTLQNPVAGLLNDDWLLLEEAIIILKPFELLTKEFSAQKFVSISKTIVLVEGARAVLKKIFLSNDSSSLAKKISRELEILLEQRFVPIYNNSVVHKSMMMDPRFKIRILHEDFKRVVQTNLQKELDLICPSLSSSPSERDLAITRSDDLLWGYFDQMIAKSAPTSTPTSTPAIKELRAYDEEDLQQIQSDPLSYWRMRKPISPYLATLAEKYLCVMGSSLPSEHFFSKTGQILRDRRTRLETEHVKMITFLNANGNLNLRVSQNLNGKF